MSIISERFENLSLNKIKLLESLYNNDDIVKMLIFNDKDFLEKDLPVDFDRTSLLYSQIFPYKYSQKIEDDPKTIITTNFVYKKHDNTYKITNFYLYIITHYTLMSCNYGLRLDRGINIIDEIVNQSRLFGVGRVEFENYYESATDNTYTYPLVCIEYKTYEFN